VATWIQTIAVLLALVFSGIATRQAARATRVSNILAMNEHHRELWIELVHTPALSRIFESSPNPPEPTDVERRFIVLVIRHMVTWRECVLFGGVPAGADARDAAEILSRPLCTKVWLEVRSFQPASFQKWADDAIAALG
jgi:hypothetical protein